MKINWQNCLVASMTIGLTALVACTAPAATPTPTPTSLEQALGLVPMDFASTTVKFAAYESARIASDAGDFKGFETLREKGSDSIPRFYPVLPQNMLGTYSERIYDHLGVDLLGNDFGIWAEMTGVAYPRAIALKDDLDRESLAKNLVDMGYKRADHKGVAYWYWSDGEPETLRGHPIGPAGRFINVVAPMDEWLVLGTSIEDATALIDTQRKDVPSLLDSKPHKVLSETLGDSLIGGIFITREQVLELWQRSDAKSMESLRRYVEGLDKWGKLASYSVALMGYRVEDGREQATVALYYSNSEAAAMDAQELERRWKSFQFSASSPDGPAESLPVTRFCSPFSTNVITYSDSSVLVGQCPILEVATTLWIVPRIWEFLLGLGEVQVLIPDLENLTPATP